MQQSLVNQAADDLGVGVLFRLAEGGQKYAGKGELSDGRPVVIKVVELRPPNADVALERARREVQLLAETDHPNIVRVLSELTQVTTGGLKAAAWLEEYLEGEDLSARLNVPWTWSDARRLGVDVGRGLGVLHARTPPVVHRDVSPNNIRCLPDGSFKVMDPGLARHIGRTSITGIYQPGTPGYLSPEHVPPGRPTPASDVFVVGILMYRALAGDLPIAVTADLNAYAIALRDGQAPSIAQARSDLTPEEVAVIDCCLRRQSARRYLNGDELADALEGVS
jgi:serine/threonine protein kinase